MAEGLPVGNATPENTENRQENRGRQRQDAARGLTNRENTANPETRAQAQTLQATDISSIHGLLYNVANFPIDIAKGSARFAWKATKGTAKFGGRMAVGGVKYPAMFGGMTVLAGGGLAGGALYLLGKGAKIALAHPTQLAIHADKKFGEGFDMVWKPIMAYASGKKK